MKDQSNVPHRSSLRNNDARVEVFGEVVFEARVASWMAILADDFLSFVILSCLVLLFGSNTGNKGDIDWQKATALRTWIFTLA